MTTADIVEALVQEEEVVACTHAARDNDNLLEVSQMSTPKTLVVSQDPVNDVSGSLQTDPLCSQDAAALEPAILSPPLPAANGSLLLHRASKAETVAPLHLDGQQAKDSALLTPLSTPLSPPKAEQDTKRPEKQSEMAPPALSNATTPSQLVTGNACRTNQDQSEQHQKPVHQHQHDLPQQYPASPLSSPSVSSFALSTASRAITPAAAAVDHDGLPLMPADVHHDLVKVLQGCQQALSSIHGRALASLNEVFHTAQGSFQVFIDSLSAPPASSPRPLLPDKQGHSGQTGSPKEMPEKQDEFVDEFVFRVKDEIESEDEREMMAKDHFQGRRDSGDRDRSPWDTQASDDRIQFLPRELRLPTPTASSSLKRHRSPTTSAARGDLGGDQWLFTDSTSTHMDNSNGRDHSCSDDQARKRASRDPAVRSNDGRRCNRRQGGWGNRAPRRRLASRDAFASDPRRPDPSSAVARLSSPAASIHLGDNHRPSSSSPQPPSQTRGLPRGADRYIPRHGRMQKSTRIPADTYRPMKRR